MEAGEEQQCRICLSDDDPDSMIAPCLCAGTGKWVHRACLDEWRAQERLPLAFSQCPQCKFEYRTTEVEDEASMRNRDMKFRIYICRDSCAIFLAVQGVIAVVAFVMHLLDRAESIKKLYPTRWADAHASLHFAIGPYYVSSVILLLALLGAVGMVLKLTNRLPQRPARTLPRNYRGARCCTCDQPCYCYYCPDFYLCHPGCAQGCGGCCDACCAGGCDCAGGGGAIEGCFSAASGAGEGAVVLLPVLLVLLVIFALIGVVVGIFFATVVIQRIFQRHAHLLAMRSETQRVVVVDLATSHLDASSGPVCSSSRSLHPPGQTIMRGRYATEGAGGAIAV